MRWIRVDPIVTSFASAVSPDAISAMVDISAQASIYLPQELPKQLEKDRRKGAALVRKLIPEKRIIMIFVHPCECFLDIGYAECKTLFFCLPV